MKPNVNESDNNSINTTQLDNDLLKNDELGTNINLTISKKSISKRIFRPIFYGIMFIGSLMAYFCIYGGIGFGLALGGIDTGGVSRPEVAIIIPGFIISLIIFFINRAIINKYERSIRDSQYSFKFIAKIYKPFLIIVLLTLPFYLLILQKIDDYGKYVIKKNDIELTNILKNEGNIDNQYTLCVDYMKKDALFNYDMRETVNREIHCKGKITDEIQMPIIKEKRDAKLCEDILTKSYIDSCVEQVATTIEDCNLIQNNVTIKDFCIQRLAITVEDCNLIENSSIRNGCSISFIKNAEDCALKQNITNKSWCAEKFATKIEDCNFIYDEKPRNECIQKLATNIEDCNLISTDFSNIGKEKDRCINNLAVSSKNKEWCKLLSSKQNQNECISNIDR